MLIFDSKGYLTPYNAIPSTLDEMRKYFVEDIPTKSRKEIFEKYIAYSEDLKKYLGNIPLKQWINGSFVTMERNPKDVDLVTFVNHSIIKKHGGGINIFRSHGSWENYGVDAYIVESLSCEKPDAQVNRI